MTDKQLAVKCIQMLEAYLTEAKNLPNDNTKTMPLTGSDMTDWKNTYYPQLVQSGKIVDGSFFQNPLKDFRYGIGNDGTCTKLEYLHFLWSAYKFVLGDFSPNGETLACIKSCIKMLEPYAARYENRGTGAGPDYHLDAADMTKWKSEYYPKLVGSGMVPDNAYFGSGGAHMGIGNDGRFVGEELFHFLFRLYRQAYIILN